MAAADSATANCCARLTDLDSLGKGSRKLSVIGGKKWTY